MNLRPSGYEPPALTAELHPRNKPIEVSANRDEYNRFFTEVYTGKTAMLKDKLEKIKDYQDQISKLGEQLSDIRVVGLLLFLGITLLIAWSGVKTIDTNYGLEKQVATLQQQNAIQKLTNGNLALQNDYYNTNQYLELEARQAFGLGVAGETELLVPTNVAMTHTVALANDQQQQTIKAATKESVYQRNFEAWMDFFLHRQTAQQ